MTEKKQPTPRVAKAREKADAKRIKMQSRIHSSRAKGVAFAGFGRGTRDITDADVRSAEKDVKLSQLSLSKSKRVGTEQIWREAINRVCDTIRSAKLKEEDKVDVAKSIMAELYNETKKIK